MSFVGRKLISSGLWRLGKGPATGCTCRGLTVTSRMGFPESSDESTSSKDDTNENVPPLGRGMTPIGKLDELPEGRHPYQEKEPLKKHPGGVNPETGEVGGPAGPEPTRYGDWERKGRTFDF